MTPHTLKPESSENIRTDASFRETIAHGTKQQPITGISFQSGPGTIYPDHFFVGRHWHPTIEIIFIKKGTYKFEINLEEFILHEGDLCFINAGDLHQITGFDSFTMHEVLLFDPQILSFSYRDEIQEQIIAPLLDQTLIFPHTLRKSEELYTFILPFIRKLLDYSTSKEDNWYFHCKLLLLELLTLLHKKSGFVPVNIQLSAVERQKISRYKQIISYIETHFSEPVSLAQISATVGLNSQYLCRFFKEFTSMTPIQYLISYRIDKACLMLADTTDSILEISLNCGFENVSYFIRKFHQLKGCTPKEYRDLSSYKRPPYE